MTANLDPVVTAADDPDPDPDPDPDSDSDLDADGAAVELAAPAWIEWSARAIAVLVVVPVRVLWELLGLATRGIYRYVLTPIGRLVRASSQALVWLVVHLLGIPVGWLVRYLVVLPARWLWGRRRVAGSSLMRYLLRPLGWFVVTVLARPAYWLLTHVIVHPVRWLARTLRPTGRLLGTLVASGWRGLIWLLSALVRLIGFTVVLLARSLYQYLLRPFGLAVVLLARLLYRYLLRPFGLTVAWLWRHGVQLLARGFSLTGVMLVAMVHGLGWLGLRLLVRPVYWLLTHLVVKPLRWLAVTLRPVGRVLVDAVVFGWHAGGWLLRAGSRLLYRYLLRPLGRAIAWAWRHSVVLLWRAVVVVWRTVVVPTARAVRRAVGSTRRYVRYQVWRPMAATTRAFLASLGLRRRR